MVLRRWRVEFKAPRTFPAAANSTASTKLNCDGHQPDTSENETGSDNPSCK